MISQEIRQLSRQRNLPVAGSACPLPGHRCVRSARPRTWLHAAAPSVDNSGAKPVPRPPEVPGLQHGLAMAQYLAAGRNIEELLLKWRHELGPFYEFSLPNNYPVVVVSDANAVKEVYEIRNYAKSPRYTDLLPLLGAQSMVVTEGETWRAQREAFNPGFGSSFLKYALPAFIGCTEHMMDALEQAAGSQQAVLMHEMAILTTTEVICKVGFGEDTQLFERGLNDPLWASFRAVGEHVAWFMDNIPFNWAKNLPWNVSKVQRLQDQLDGHLLAILRKRLAAMGIPEEALEGRTATSGAGASHHDASLVAAASAESGASRCPVPHDAGPAAASDTSSSATSEAVVAAEDCPFHTAASSSSTPGATSSSSSKDAFGDTKDILSLALKLSVKDGALDRDQLLSQMKTFYAAGHDTTASLVAWAVYYLCQHPEAAAKLHAEVDRVMAGAAQPTYQQLTDMKYLNCVLKETLRVRPPIGVLARFAPEGTSLHGYNTSNKVILVSPYILHVEPSVWGPDAAEWKPERWEDEQGVAANVPAYSYMPFSRGPRDCIGARFALLEAKTIMSMLYSRYDVEYAGKAEQVMMSITAHPKYGVPVKVVRRAAAGSRAREQGQEQQRVQVA